MKDKVQFDNIENFIKEIPGLRVVVVNENEVGPMESTELFYDIYSKYYSIDQSLFVLNKQKDKTWRLEQHISTKIENRLFSIARFRAANTKNSDLKSHLKFIYKKHLKLASDVIETNLSSL